MEQISVLMAAIKKLEDCNLALKADSYRNPSRRVKNNERIQKNESMILDYKFRISQCK